MAAANAKSVKTERTAEKQIILLAPADPCAFGFVYVAVADVTVTLRLVSEESLDAASCVVIELEIAVVVAALMSVVALAAVDTGTVIVYEAVIVLPAPVSFRSESVDKRLEAVNVTATALADTLATFAMPVATAFLKATLLTKLEALVTVITTLPLTVVIGLPATVVLARVVAACVTVVVALASSVVARTVVVKTVVVSTVVVVVVFGVVVKTVVVVNVVASVVVLANVVASVVVVVLLLASHC